MSRLCAVFLVSCLLISVASSASSCLGAPDTFKKGQICGNGPASCTFGYYCADDGTCQTSVAPGGTCLQDTDCQFGSICKGNVGSKTCVAYATLGAKCNQTVSSMTPSCAPSYSCDFVHNFCTGGGIGDTCAMSGSNDPCAPSLLTCTNGVCTPAADGSNCTFPKSVSCGPQSFCDLSVVPNVCTPQKTQGICTSNSICASGYTCTQSSPTDPTSECIPIYSRSSGQYCSSDLVCGSPNRCEGHYCAAGTTTYCTSAQQCSDYQVCTCNGLWLDSGIGQCQNNPCWGVEQDYAKCIKQNCFACEDELCRDYTYDGMVGQCVANKCSSQWKAKIACDSAAELFASAFFATLLAFFVHFTSKKF